MEARFAIEVQAEVIVALRADLQHANAELAQRQKTIDALTEQLKVAQQDRPPQPPAGQP